MAPLLCPIEIRRVRRVGSPHGTGSGNKSRLVAFESTRLEQRRGMLTFDEIMKFVVYYTTNFPHWYWLCSTFGVASRKPEVEKNGGWWRLRVLGWNKLETRWHFVKVWGFYFMAPLLCPIDFGWPCSTCGVASRKPEVEISRGWWRLRVLGRSNVGTCWHLMRSWILSFITRRIFHIDIGCVRPLGSRHVDIL